MLSSTNITIIYFIIVLIVSALVPTKYTPHVFIFVILFSLLVFYFREAQINENYGVHKITTLKKRIQEMIDSGYVKNNENIPLRRISTFKYIFLEDELILLLSKLLKYEGRYKDIVYSTIYYSEAFMRQVFRMLEGKVKDEKQARNLGENIINQLHSLSYDASKYEAHNMKQLQERFTEFVWTMYESAANAVSTEFDPESPSPFDAMHSDNYDLCVF